MSRQPLEAARRLLEFSRHPLDRLGSVLRPTESLAGLLAAALRDLDLAEVLRRCATDADADHVLGLARSYEFTARGAQLVSLDEDETLVLAGRGWGKTRAGVMWIHRLIRSDASLTHGLIVGPTIRAVRDTCIDGPSGFLSVLDAEQRPTWSPNSNSLKFRIGRRVVNVLVRAANKPDDIRGPSCHFAWCDEIVAWARGAEPALKQIEMALREGARTRRLYTTTPRPLAALRELAARPKIRIVRGNTFDNAANLAPNTIARLRGLVGSRWGRQELMGEMLDADEERPLDVSRLRHADRWDDGCVLVGDARLRANRVVVAVDPAATANARSDETGIVALAELEGDEGAEAYAIISDRSGKHSPGQWAQLAINEATRLQADEGIVVEVNTGGDAASYIIRNAPGGSSVAVNEVRATRDKRQRAGLLGALIEAGRVYLVDGLDDVRRELEEFTGAENKKDGRVDAITWALTHLLAQGRFSII